MSICIGTEIGLGTGLSVGHDVADISVVGVSPAAWLGGDVGSSPIAFWARRECADSDVIVGTSALGSAKCHSGRSTCTRVIPSVVVSMGVHAAAVF